MAWTLKWECECKRCGRTIIRSMSQGPVDYCKSLSCKRPPEVIAAQRAAVVEIGHCEKCGAMDRLHGHHIQHYAKRPDLGAERSNIRVLCGRCHADEHPEIPAAFRKSMSK